jgi:hypothetical protein
MAATTAVAFCLPFPLAMLSDKVHCVLDLGASNQRVMIEVN